MTLDRYLRKEVLANLLGVLTVLLLIFLGNRFVRFLGDALDGKLPHDTILTVLMLKLVSALVVIVPLALYLAVLLGFGRFYRDNEMTAMLASGVSPLRMAKGLLWLVLPIALVIGFLSLQLSPWAEEQVERIHDEVQSRTELRGLSAGRFIEDKTGNGVLYIDHIDDDSAIMRNVFAQWRKDGRLATVTAKRGYVKEDEAYGARYLVLEEGYRYEGEPGAVGFRIIHFQRHTIYLEARPIKVSHRRDKALSTMDLLRLDSLSASAEFQRRLSMPIATILLALLALPLSKVSPRQGRYSRLLLAILVYAVYSNMLTVAQSWVSRDVIPVGLGLWWVHGIVLVIVTFLFARMSGVRLRPDKQIRE
ncbi:MAG: LPS export ABC transporter permease LptF [Gammaproteobacteria bacterium]|nr:LPS export ABC transporter permease LptF [Gammaproteobacteria bacterium]PCH62187.1 MAG: LPS export ABC transporter permease LptF [Gammaproteobacteria bacterium]PCH63308.1 MAG: LPS export ABC transporter permease LptF [Gammaproteobacteria bacterium]